jgi:hypothetical protein
MVLGLAVMHHLLVQRAVMGLMMTVTASKMKETSVKQRVVYAFVVGVRRRVAMVSALALRYVKMAIV